MSFPSGINKIIEEYCIYPKKYLEELQYKTFKLRDNIDSLRYNTLYVLWVSIGGIRLIPFLATKYPNDEIRNALITKQNNRRFEFGIRDNPNTNGCYYHY